MEVVWTSRARDRLRSIREFISEDSPQVAKNVIARLIHRSEQLALPSHLGRKVPEYQFDEIREVLERPYRIIYRISSNRIDVLTVMHYRQLLPQDIKQL